MAAVSKRSAYRKNIARWEKVFPAAQMLYLAYRRIRPEPEAVLREIEAFIGDRTLELRRDDRGRCTEPRRWRSPRRWPPAWSSDSPERAAPGSPGRIRPAGFLLTAGPTARMTSPRPGRSAAALPTG